MGGSKFHVIMVPIDDRYNRVSSIRLLTLIIWTLIMDLLMEKLRKTHIIKQLKDLRIDANS